MGGAGGGGGGIFNTGVLALTDCTIDNNIAGSGGQGGYGILRGGPGGPGGIGGGIYSQNSLSLLGCTVVSNRSGYGGIGGQSSMNPGVGGDSGGGGGIFGGGALTNCTIAVNYCASASGPPGLPGRGGSGGGICGGPAVVSCTIVSNSAGWGPLPSNSGSGGGVSGSGVFLNSIVALNSAFNNAQGPDVLGTFTSLGHNLIGATNDSSGFTAPGDLVGSKVSPLDPRLAPLADNGGPTLTTALLPGSPAIDTGAATGAPSTDQRGVTRPQGAGVDIGAYEFQFTIPQITGARFLSSSNFWLQSCGLSNQGYSLQVSTNLVSWSDLTNLTADPNGVCQFVDCSAAQCGARFYRLKVLRP